MGVRRGIDRKKVGYRQLIDANLEGQGGVNKFKLYIYDYNLFKATVKSAYKEVKGTCL